MRLAVSYPGDSKVEQDLSHSLVGLFWCFGVRLREPNREALETIAFSVSQYFQVEQGQAPYEAAIDSATGMGKTYILAAAIEYLAFAENVCPSGRVSSPSGLSLGSALAST